MHAINKSSSHEQVVEHVWGDDVSPLRPGKRAPDVITGADVVYEKQHFPALLATLRDLAAPHTRVYLAFRLRGPNPLSLPISNSHLCACH